jgi:hypothetical protein
VLLDIEELAFLVLEGEVVLDDPGQLVDGADLSGPRLFGERLGSLAVFGEEVR